MSPAMLSLLFLICVGSIAAALAVILSGVGMKPSEQIDVKEGIRKVMEWMDCEPLDPALHAIVLSMLPLLALLPTEWVTLGHSSVGNLYKRIF